MQSFDPYSLSATIISQRVRDGSLRAEEVAGSYIQRVDDIHQVFNTHLGWQKEAAMNEIDKQIDYIRAARLANRHLPLAGVPIAIKDNIMVDGHTVSCG